MHSKPNNNYKKTKMLRKYKQTTEKRKKSSEEN